MEKTLSKIFITGASGFVGKQLSAHLQTRGYEIIALVHDMGQEQPPPKATLVQGDIRDYRLLKRVLIDYSPDFVIHLAAEAIVSRAQRDPYHTFDVNVNGTNALLNAILDSRAKTHLIHFSTDKVYGNGRGKTEQSPLAATGIYETSKACADLWVQAFSQLIATTIVRPCNLYGPSDYNYRVIPNTIRSCLRAQNPIVYKGETVREYLYINDLARAIDIILQKQLGGIWNLSSHELKTNEEAVMEILKHFPNLEPQYFAPPPIFELQDQSLDSSRFRSTGWKTTSFNEGIRRTAEWWKQETRATQ